MPLLPPLTAALLGLVQAQQGDHVRGACMEWGRLGLSLGLGGGAQQQQPSIVSLHESSHHNPPPASLLTIIVDGLRR